MSQPQSADRTAAAAQLRSYTATRDEALQKQVGAASDGNPRLREILRGFVSTARRVSDQIITDFETHRTP